MPVSRYSTREQESPLDIWKIQWVTRETYSDGECEKFHKYAIRHTEQDAIETANYLNEQHPDRDIRYWCEPRHPKDIPIIYLNDEELAEGILHKNAQGHSYSLHYTEAYAWDDNQLLRAGVCEDDFTDELYEKYGDDWPYLPITDYNPIENIMDGEDIYNACLWCNRSDLDKAAKDHGEKFAKWWENLAERFQYKYLENLDELMNETFIETITDGDYPMAVKLEKQPSRHDYYIYWVSGGGDALRSEWAYQYMFQVMCQWENRNLPYGWEHLVEEEVSEETMQHLVFGKEYIAR